MPGEKELALRAHDESIESVNKGNFLQLLDLITKDDVIANVVQQHCSAKEANGINRLNLIQSGKDAGNYNLD